MTISEYEAMYTSVTKAEQSTRDLDKVVALLRDNPQRSWSVKDLRLAIYGDTADKRNEANRIAQILQHLISRGRVRRVLVECEPIYTHLVYFYQWCA